MGKGKNKGRVADRAPHAIGRGHRSAKWRQPRWLGLRVTGLRPGDGLNVGEGAPRRLPAGLRMHSEALRVRFRQRRGRAGLTAQRHAHQGAGELGQEAFC